MEQKFKPFQQVLVRDEKDNEWMCDIYSQYDNETEYHSCVGGRYKYCIPYEGNENLLGTTNSSQPKRWRAEHNCEYYYISNLGDVFAEIEHYHPTDDLYYSIGNYFQTRAEAQAMAEKFKQLLKEE